MGKTLNRIFIFILIGSILSLTGSYFFAQHIWNNISSFTQANVFLPAGSITLNIYIEIAVYLFVSIMINVIVPYALHMVLRKKEIYKNVYAVFPIAGFSVGCALGYFQYRKGIFDLTKIEWMKGASIVFDMVIYGLLKAMLTEGSLLMGMAFFAVVFFLTDKHVKVLSLSAIILLLIIFLGCQFLIF